MGLWHCFTYIVLDGWKIDEHRTCWKPPTGRNGKTTVMEKKKHVRWRVTELCWEIYATSRHGHSKDCKMWTWSTWYPCTIITSISIYNQRTHRTRLFTRGAPLAGSIQRPSCTEQLVPEWPAGWAYFIEVCSSTNLIQFDLLKKYMYYYVTMYFNIQVAVRKAPGCLYLFGSPGWSRGGPGRPDIVWWAMAGPPIGAPRNLFPNWLKSKVHDPSF